MDISNINDKELLKELSQQNLSLYTDLMQCKIHWCHFSWPQEEFKSKGFHQHMVSELHYTISGVKTFHFQEDSVVNVGAGQYILVPSACWHALNCDNPETMVLVIGFAADSNTLPLRQILNSCLNGKKAALENPIISYIVEALITQTRSGNDILRSSAAYLTNAMVLEALKDLSIFYHCDNTFNPYVQAADSRANEISAFIREHKFESIRVEDVASHIGLQIRQANRICEQAFGCSVTALIKQERIDSIKELLETTNYSLAQIAEISGFSNVYSMIRHFHAYTGMTPGAYRKNAGYKP